MNKTLKCIIVDDEPTARLGLRGYVDKTDGLQCVAMADDAMTLDAYIDRTRHSEDAPDIIFIDIEMPGMSGLDYLESKRVDAAVIVVTAYEQYALRGYELNVTDYLLKPVSFTRFAKAVDKARKFVEMCRGINTSDYIFLRADRKLHKVDSADIIYVQGLENYVIVHTPTERIITRTTMRQLLASLPPSHFLQVHKSYIVNLSKIRSIEGHILHLESGHDVPIARSMRNDIYLKYRI